MDEAGSKVDAYKVDMASTDAGVQGVADGIKAVETGVTRLENSTHDLDTRSSPPIPTPHTPNPPL